MGDTFTRAVKLTKNEADTLILALRNRIDMLDSFMDDGWDPTKPAEYKTARQEFNRCEKLIKRLTELFNFQQ